MARQPARQLHRRARRAGADEGAALRPHPLHLVDHRPACHQPRPRPLFGDQGRHQRLHPRRRARILRLRHHRQRRRAGQHPDRGDAAPPRPEPSSRTWKMPSRSAGSAARATSPMPSCSSRRTRPSYITGTTIVVDGGQLLPEGGFQAAAAVSGRQACPTATRDHAWWPVS